MKKYALLALILGFCHLQWGFSLDMRNRIDLTNIIYLQTQEDQDELIILWQPEFNLDHSFSTDFSLTGQLMGNATAKQIFRSGDDRFVRSGKLNRLWLAAGTPLTEGRIGLQRINFGSAQILRPLQWFDNIDPTGDLEQTEGVQALLLRHYFLNNANLWLWGVRGEEKFRGQLLTLTKEGTPEFGGRIQYPTPRGEVALTVNHRQETVQSGFNTGSENRIGLDCKQDFGIGVWMEGYISKSERAQNVPKWQTPVTFGADYTISVGNGLYILLETELWAQADNSLTDLYSKQVTYAFSSNYPLGLLDRILYYGNYTDDGYVSVHSVIWRRDYDRLSWDLSLFWDTGQDHSSYNSRGIKALVSYMF